MTSVGEMAAAPAEPEDEGGGFGVLAALGVTLGRIADRLDDQANRRQRLYESLHQVPQGPAQIPINGGAGVLSLPDVFQCKTGYCRSVRRLTASGFTAGSVTTYLNGLLVGGVLVGTPEPVAPFPQAGVLTFGRGELLLQQDDTLTFAATGITLSSGFAGVQINGIADEFEAWLLPDYLE